MVLGDQMRGPPQLLEKVETVAVCLLILAYGISGRCGTYMPLCGHCSGVSSLARHHSHDITSRIACIKTGNCCCASQIPLNPKPLRETQSCTAPGQQTSFLTSCTFSTSITPPSLSFQTVGCLAPIRLDHVRRLLSHGIDTRHDITRNVVGERRRVRDTQVLDAVDPQTRVYRVAHRTRATDVILALENH